MIIASCSGAGIYGGAMLYLNQIWYKKYRTYKFHFFNDNDEWFQMDKVGHGFSAYYISQLAYHGLLWPGNSKRKSIWYAAGISTVVLSSIEVLDGFSSGWGASVGDILANTLGASLFVLQEKIWKEQRIKLKFSVFPSKYAKYRPETLGASFAEQFLKDYNGQTYWASINIEPYLKIESFPKWINIAGGYSVKGLLGGTHNPVKNKEGETVPCFTRQRQFLFAPDIDLEKIKTNSKFIKTVLKLANTLKFPAPAIEFNSKGVKWHWLYF